LVIEISLYNDAWSEKHQIMTQYDYFKISVKLLNHYGRTVRHNSHQIRQWMVWL